MLALIAAIVLIEMLSTKLRIAYPVLLVVGGLIISFIQGLPKAQVDPDMIYNLFYLKQPKMSLSVIEN